MEDGEELIKLLSMLPSPSLLPGRKMVPGYVESSLEEGNIIEVLP